MNALEFWSRIFWGVMVGILSLGEFNEKKLLAGTAGLITVFLLIFSPLLMLGRHQRPRPLSSLKQEFDIYMLLTWNRGLVGMIIGIGCVALLDPSRQSKDNDAAATPVLFLLSGLLLTPLSSKVFSFPPPNRALHGRWRWSVKAGVIYFTRCIGVFITVIGACMIGVKDMKLVGAIIFLSCGIVLVFINQVQQFFSGPATIIGEPALEVTGQASVPEPEIQAEQPVPVVQPAYQPVDTAVIKSPPLVEQYKELQALPVAKKGTAYGTFLTRLFNNEGLLTSSAFTVKDTAISGSFELDGQIYILVAKWQPEKSDENALLIFNTKVESRSTWARGIFISEAGFSKDGLTLFAQGKRTSIIGMDGQDLQLVLEGKISLREAIKRKARRAVETNNFFVPLQKLI